MPVSEEKKNIETDTKKNTEKVQDVEMKDEPKETEEEKKARETREAFNLLVSDIKKNLVLIQRGVIQNDERVIGRAIRQIFYHRRKMDRKVLSHVLQTSLPNTSERKNRLLDLLSKHEMDIEETTVDVEAKKAAKIPEIDLPEIEIMLQLLVTVYLIDNKLYEEAKECATDLVKFLETFNRRTLNLLGSKVYFYYSRAYELVGKLSTIRGHLLKALRTATLRHDNYVQAVVLNLLLRNYLADNLYDQANKLITKTPPIDFRSNSQMARYCYYKGRIKAVQLEYTEAYSNIMTAIRKAPTVGAVGFRTAAWKLAIIIKLLMGEIPERSVFAQKGLKKALQPYLALTKEVRVGDLPAFRRVVSQNRDLYIKDKTYTLIQRIRQNVIRTGLKKISTAYSRISLADICEKLHLDTPEDVEFIVAKAIRDGIIDATIDHESGYLQTKEGIDIYATLDPTEAFHNRIQFTMKIHNEAVKAMRFPPKKKSKEELEEAEERLRRTDEEIAEMAEEDDDEGDFE